MVDYTENYSVTKKAKRALSEQFVDKSGRIIEPRRRTDQDLVLDLKYRVSRPDPKTVSGVQEHFHFVFHTDKFLGFSK